MWQIFIFQYSSKFTYRSSMQRAIYDATIVSIATYTVHSAAYRRSMHACELTQRAARDKRHELPLCRHFRTVSKYVRVSADALTAANRHARHGRRVRRVVQCVRLAANAARWLAGRPVAESIKGRATNMSVHSWGVAREDDMTDWEPDR